jgi:hypothetical protein
MRLTLVQVLMTGRGLSMNPMQSLYYVSPACLISLLVPFRAYSGLPVAAAQSIAAAGACGSHIIAHRARPQRCGIGHSIGPDPAT